MIFHLITPIWLNLFHINFSILTIRDSYALKWRSLRITIKDWHWVLTDELVCTSPLDGRVDIVNRNVWPYLLSIADMYQVERLKLHCESKMWDMASEETDFIFTMGNSG
jgi:hypothetical protein